MVISLSHGAAWHRFVEHGSVLTFRSSRRSRTPDDGTPQETWVNRGRGERAVADAAVVMALDGVEPTDEVIDAEARRAGFPSGEAWRAAIDDLHGDPHEIEGVLYQVVRLDWREAAVDHVDGLDESEVSER